jgi:hypothetical protein
MAKRIWVFLSVLLCWYGTAEAASEDFFQLTPQAFEQLVAERIPPKVLDALKTIEDEAFSEENAFLQAVEEHIGKESTAQYEKPLCKLAHQIREKDGVVKRATKWSVKTAISILKELLSGLVEGIDEGLSAAIGHDDAQVVTNAKELQRQKLEIIVLGVTASNSRNVTNVDLGFKNPGDKPIRITHLRDASAVQLIDKDGFATGLANSFYNPANVIVPPRASVQQRFQLRGDHASARFLRLFTLDIDLCPPTPHLPPLDY